MGGFKLTGLGAGNAAGNSIRYEQLFSAGGASGIILLNPGNTTQALTDQATITWDASSGAYATVTLGGNRTFAAPSNLVVGGRYVLRITQDGTGGRTVTWNAVFKAQGGLSMQQPDTAAAAVTTFIFDSDGTNLYSASSYTPPGTVWDHAGSTAPTGWLECDGSAVSRITYANLFNAISTTWGVGNGSTTFNLPDYRGKGRIGRGTGTVTESVTNTAINTGTDTITVTSNATKWVTGMQVTWTVVGTPPTTSPANLLDNADVVFVIRTGATSIKFATSLANAQNGTAIDITAAGSGTFTLTTTFTARTIGEYGGEESHAMSSTELLAHTHDAVSSAAVSLVYPAGGANANSVSGSAGGNAAMNIMGPFGVGMTIIKT